MHLQGYKEVRFKASNRVHDTCHIKQLDKNNNDN